MFDRIGSRAYTENMTKKPKRPRDTNQLAKLIADVATGRDKLPEKKPPPKNSASVELGRLGGLKGGKARAKKLTPKQRSEIARKAAKARWNKKSK